MSSQYHQSIHEELANAILKELVAEIQLKDSFEETDTTPADLVIDGKHELENQNYDRKTEFALRAIASIPSILATGNTVKSDYLEQLEDTNH